MSIPNLLPFQQCLQIISIPTIDSKLTEYMGSVPSCFASKNLQITTSTKDNSPPLPPLPSTQILHPNEQVLEITIITKSNSFPCKKDNNPQEHKGTNQSTDSHEEQEDSRGLDIEEIQVDTKQDKIKWQDFTVLKTIGRGTYGSVFLCSIKNTYKNCNTSFAVKQMNKELVYSKKISQNIQLQKNIMKTAKNTNFITQLKCSFRNEENYYLAMQWAQGGDVYSFIKPGSKRKAKFRYAGESSVRFILACTVLGLQYLHSNGIVFQDLKPENLLVFEDGYVKLTDFGLSRQIDQKGSRIEKRVGTPAYLAPQMVLQNKSSKAGDLWALGVLAYQLSNYYVPFGHDVINNEEKFIRRVKIGEKLRVWSNKYIHKELKDFINDLLKFQSQKRLGMGGWAEIKNHDFFKVVEFNWTALEQKKLISPLLPILTENNTCLSYDDCNQSQQLSKIDLSDTISNWSEDLQEVS